MKNSEIFNLVLARVCEECEMPQDLVLSESKLQFAVDARVLAVQYMRRAGLSNNDIALCLYRRECGDPLAIPPAYELRMKAKTIQRMFDSYSQRCDESDAFVSRSIVICEWKAETLDKMNIDGRRAVAKKFHFVPQKSNEEEQ